MPFEIDINEYNKTVVAVVDAYSTGCYLGSALRARGVTAIHIRNMGIAPQAHRATFRSHDFALDINYEGGFDELVSALRKLKVKHIIAGAESGTTLADSLATRLNLSTANAPGFSVERRDKSLMHRALANVGIRVPWQQHVSSDGNIIWTSEGVGPVVTVVKPARSAGTDNVHICTSFAECKKAIDQVLETYNVFGERNSIVIVQEYVDGDEFMINTVSTNGIHSVVEIWRSVKKHVGNSPVYDHQSLVDPTSSQALVISAYVRSSLDALGVTWGAAHTEVIVRDGVPYLLETATRLPGGLDPSLGMHTIGRGLIDELLDAYLCPELVVRRGINRPLIKQALGVSLICPRGGVLIQDISTDDLIKLESYHGHRLNGKKGVELRKTVDMLSKPGGVYLVHTDPEKLYSDYQKVREWEMYAFNNAIDGSNDNDAIGTNAAI